jgi:hypothetical protein
LNLRSEDCVKARVFEGICGNLRVSAKNAPAFTYLFSAVACECENSLGATVPATVAPFGAAGYSQQKSPVAAAAPSNCATIKPGASVGRMLAKVLLATRASVTAGFANDVDDVNQYAAVMYSATANGVTAGRLR